MFLSATPPEIGSQLVLVLSSFFTIFKGPVKYGSSFLLLKTWTNTRSPGLWSNRLKQIRIYLSLLLQSIFAVSILSIASRIHLWCCLNFWSQYSSFHIYFSFLYLTPILKVVNLVFYIIIQRYWILFLSFLHALSAHKVLGR